jgi:short-subunit dehydrogenase
VYAASKSFLLLFSEALWLELEPHGVHVLAVCPGPVVSETLRAFDKKQPVLVPGTLVTRIQAFAHRVLPRAVVARIAARVSEKIMMTGAK